ncbi:thiolase family protein [Companilactobacillus futsaii]|uniref:acetyl-CoA C-acetyltransferase n=2 Tax=Companilactobacillus futsaii TaxID=938155 RepID=A0A5B7SXM6_9LACO|nr:thiolase family protein [Companilactobacillus futsaii]KRK96584.1 Acetyl-CoA acetyltransferase [Companilactobacillus futsaii JCM 17355]QCX24123.1 thiolase family protein [Companilactobacillus futsaii]
MDPIVIIDAKRTAIGKFRGQFADLTAVQLGTQLVSKLLKKNHLDPKLVDQFIFGNVYQTGMGQNTARQIELNAGGRVDATAMTVNQVCGSGMKAVYEGISAITMGNADIVVSGGVESMSNAPFYAPRTGKMEVSPKLSDALFNDGLNDAFSHLPMGLTAENVAKKFHITREQQDEFALQSHQRAHKAESKLAREIIPIEVNGEEITTDQSIRPTTTLEQMGKLRTVFDKKGTVTAGNSSPINDGAAALILMRASRAKELGLDYVAQITGYTEVGIDPNYMGYAPYYAIKKYFKRYQTDLADYDLFEVNEAFAAQAVAVGRDLEIPNDKLNIYGGAIALGHPLGATGTRMIATLINSLQQEHKTTGLASLCIGGGMGMAMGVELNENL